MGYDSRTVVSSFRKSPVPVSKKIKPRTYALVSLGCPKNLVDSERMAGLLERAGYQMVPDADGAELAVVNTCGFIGDARAESHEVIEELLRLKQRGRLRKVIVAGCLAERDREALFERYPAIDQLIGVFARDEIVDAIALLAEDSEHRGNNIEIAGSQRLPEGRQASANSPGAVGSRLSSDDIAPGTPAGTGPRALFRPAPSQPLPDTGRLRITLPHLAYLKIAEGCNRLCSFCSIPSLRGPYASKPIDEAVAEAKELAADGVRELVLVAQDTTFYGLDTDGRPRLAELLRRLQEVDGLAWIRLMYLYPDYVTDELIDVIASGEKIVPYLDIPLQHINDEVLRRMRRRVGRDDTERLLDRLRERIGSLVLRTTLMAGFPGETEGQFGELLDFVARRRFERLGAFAYCNEPGTPAAELDGHLPEEVKQARRDRLMAVQQPIAFAWNASQVGKRRDVMIDRCISVEQNAYVGRGYADAPEVDGQVYVTGADLQPGQIVPCEIVATKDYDLIAVVV
jgi:ribosomal protein S12 methylthiotransferase